MAARGLAILAMVLGLGMGLAYVIEAAIDPNTGSYGDQGAIVLAGAGAGLSWIAVGLDRWTARPARILLLGGASLAIVALMAGSVSAATFIVVGLVGMVLGALGLLVQGSRMWSSSR